MTIRTFEAGDEATQVSIYNESAAELPRFKPAALDEVRRRCRGPDFDRGTRFFALANGKPVGYAGFHLNGRLSYPWCRKGHEQFAEPLLAHVLSVMRGRGLTRAFAAYRGDWPAQQQFFLGHGFSLAREMINHVLDLAEMPTPAARASSTIGPLLPADVPAVLALGGGVPRTSDAAELEAHLFRNPYFGPESLFALRSRTNGVPVAVGLVVANPTYADPKQVDALMPCFRLGAFGTEGMQTKRINGLFSFVAADNRDLAPFALDLMGYASLRLQDTEVESFGAQVPSDAAHLVRFYKQHFRRQGSFPIFERAL
jgi:hypothetical protein